MVGKEQKICCFSKHMPLMPKETYDILNSYVEINEIFIYLSFTIKMWIIKPLLIYLCMHLKYDKKFKTAKQYSLFTQALTSVCIA